MTKSSATSQIEGKNKTIDYKKLYQEQAKKHQLMLSQISHEIRNPVTLINSFLQILEKQHPDLSEDQNWIKILENITDKCLPIPLVILRLEGACVLSANEHFTFFVSV